MSKKQIVQGVLTILAAAIAAALSFFFASCSTSSHLELKHSQDSLVIRKDDDEYPEAFKLKSSCFK